MNWDDLYYHFLPGDGCLTHDMSGSKAEPGVLHTIPNPVLCERGWHGSKRAIHALGFSRGAILDMRRLSGTVLHDTDKTVASDCEIVCVVDATRTLHEFAIWCAEQALAIVEEHDPRSIEVLAVKRRWLDGDATDDELTAARDAARDAAWAAARDAARVAVRAAARDAAWAAARAAAWAAVRDAARGAAWAAARDAARDAQNIQLESMLRELVEQQVEANDER